MRLVGIIAAVLGGAATGGQAQTVSISNVSHPGTALEPGDTVSINISSATPGAPVTVMTLSSAGSSGPYLYGYVQSNGTWTTSSPVTASVVGAWQEYWYVNGVYVKPANPNMTYLPYAPTLPSFTIYANSSPACPGMSTVSYSLCGGNSTPAGWNFTPVGYTNNSVTVPVGAAPSDASSWNSVQNVISLASVSYPTTPAIPISDNTSITSIGYTEVYGGQCAPCYGYLDQCSGKCDNAAAMYQAVVLINSTMVNAAASAYSAVTNSTVTAGTVATLVLNHEFGHALRLADVTAAHGTCSEVGSIMYSSSSVLFGCGAKPTTSCDGNVLTNTVYATPPGTCEPVNGGYCIESSGFTCQ